MSLQWLCSVAWALDTVNEQYWVRQGTYRFPFISVSAADLIYIIRDAEIFALARP